MSNSRRARSGSQTPGRGSSPGGSQAPPQNRQPESEYSRATTQYGQTQSQSTQRGPGYDQPATEYSRTEPRHRRPEPQYRETEAPRKRPMWHYLLLGVLGLIAIGGIISAAVVGGTSTPAPSAAPPGVTRLAPVGTTFLTRDATGTTYRVRLDNVVDPARGVDGTTAASGNRLVGAVYTITGVSGSPAGENVVTNASLLSSTGHIYRATGGRIAGYGNFNNSNITVAKSSNVTGAAAYQIPSGVKITQAQWASAAGTGIIARWAVP
jgi:hypothetical protein